MSAPARLWNRYWFRPAPLVDLAVCRILLAGMWLVVFLFPYALLTVPPYTMFAEQLGLPEQQYDPLPFFRLLTLPFGADYRPTVLHLTVAYDLSIAAAAGALLGLFTRTCLAVLAAGVLFMVGHSFSYGDYHHIETVPLILLVLLALAPSGEVLSIDDWRRRRRLPADAPPPPPLLERSSPRAGWPLRAMMWVLSIVYLSAALCKLGGGGLRWLDGYTLQHYIMRDALHWGSDLGIWLADQHALVVALSWFAVLFEGTFFLVLFLPRLRPLYALAGAGFHVSIFLTMFAPFVLYLPAYAVMLPWAAWARRIAGRRTREGTTPSSQPSSAC